MSALAELSPVFRPMRAADLETVARIERAVYPFPWARGNFRDCLSAGYDCWILEIEKEIAGYGVVLVGPGEAHLLNLSIKAAWQGYGLGRRLLEYFMEHARRSRASVMLLEVRPSNPVAKGLYESAGFKSIGIRRGYYPASRGREDAIVMEKQL
jgi:ribosomal-protein-alanine N-acetyltransferase